MPFSVSALSCYQENRPYQIRYRKAKNPDDYFRKHETELILYDGAKEMMRRAKIDHRTLDINKLRAEFSQMEQKKKELRQAYQTAEKDGSHSALKDSKFLTVPFGRGGTFCDFLFQIRKYDEWSADKHGDSRKSELRRDINAAIRSADTYDEFLHLLRSKGYVVKGENGVSRDFALFQKSAQRCAPLCILPQGTLRCRAQNAPCSVAGKRYILKISRQGFLLSQRSLLTAEDAGTRHKYRRI